MATIGYRLYRGVGGLANVDFSTPLGTVVVGSSEWTFSGIAHAPLRRYVYVLRAVRKDASGNWLETPDLSCVAEVVTDAAGQWVGVRPGAAESVEADVLAAGQVRVRWQYRTAYGAAAPEAFDVYCGLSADLSDATPERVEFATDGPYATVLSLTGGKAYFIAVAARSAAGVRSPLSQIVGPVVARSAVPRQPVVTVEQTF